MGLTVLRPDDVKRVIGVKGHWGKDPHATKPADVDAVALVPVASYGYNSLSNLWLPQPVGGGGAPVVEVQEENEYIMVEVDLSIGRAVPTQILYGGNPVTGRSMAIWSNPGTFNLRFTDGVHDPIPVGPLTYPAMITFVREITNIYVDNLAQIGKAILYVGQRV